MRKRGAGVVYWKERWWSCGGKKKKPAVEKLFHFKMKRADRVRVISKGNIITFSYLLLECCGGGQGRRGSTEEHLKVITLPEVYLLFLFTLSPVFTSLHLTVHRSTQHFSPTHWYLTGRSCPEIRTEMRYKRRQMRKGKCMWLDGHNKD